MSPSTPSVVAAFVAGLFSFLSPCVLPLVPGYISLISGTGVAELQAGDRKLARVILLQSAMFIAGFSLVFIALGALAGSIAPYKRYILPVAGAIIILFGLHLTGLVKIKALYADKRLHDLGAGNASTGLGAFLVGFAFAFGWTPCIGPILGAILALAASQDVAKGAALLAVYSLGLAVPFLLTSLGIDRFLTLYARFRQRLHAVEVASGVLLIALGTLVLLGRLTVIANKLAFLNRFAL